MSLSSSSIRKIDQIRTDCSLQFADLMKICNAIQLINVDVSIEAYGEIMINFKRSTREDFIFIKSLTKLY